MIWVLALIVGLIVFVVELHDLRNHRAKLVEINASLTERSHT